jgi:Cys-rich four helix bundle protein (predicted Tat secretion target)
MEETMDRREFMTTTAAAAGAVLMAAGGANAEGGAPGAAHGPAGDFPPLALSSGHCVATGQACLAHCMMLFESGDTTLAGCARSVNELIVACGALQALAIDKSAQLPAFAKAVGAVCEACEKECRKHEAKHEVCKACAESCKACAAECKKIAA